MENGESTHVDDGALLALLDGELTAQEAASLETHLSSCSDCAARRDEMRFVARRVSAALEALDEPSPVAEMPEGLKQAARESVRSIESARSRVRRVSRSGRRSLATAAGLTLVLAAGAYALPGSPIRGWVDESVSAIAEFVGLTDSGPVDVGPSVVSVEPVDQAVRVSVLGATSALRITIALTDESTASASARDAQFRIGSGLIEVRDAAGLLEIELPASVEDVSVEIDGAVVAEVRDGRLVRAAGADSSPAEILLEAGG